MPNWKYGNYTFISNPSTAEEEVSFIGDIIRTSSGRLIIQPTTYVRNLSLESLFYQAHDSLQERYYLASSYISIAVSGTSIFLLRSSGVIDRYNYNMVYLSSLSPTISGIPIALTYDGVSLWLCAEQSSTQYTLYEVSPVDGSISKTFVYTDVPARAVGLGYLGNFPYGYLVKLRNDGIVESINPSDGRIVAYHQDIAKYTFTSLAGGNCDVDIMYVIKDGNKVLIYNVSDDRVIDIIDLVLNTFSYLSICNFNDYFLLIPSSVNEVHRYFLNTVVKDVYNLEKQVASGRVSMIDEYGNNMQVIVNDYNISRREGLYKAYNIDLSVALLG
ncbi:MAG: hypothetical protein AB7E45_02115 [Candidatus Caldatribacteriota bacterium]